MSTGQPDLLLLHPPSVYDFRKKAIMYGPVSDLIPSSPVFEMYPLGFLTMTSFLEARGARVRIANLALRMMNDRNFDVPEFLAGIQPRAIGIDLHWLPHAHGSLEIARIAKQLHPDVPVIFGGLSSTYYHEELIRYPQVDFVLRGNSVEPPLFDLLRCLQDSRAPAEIQNLTWKHEGQVRVNPMSFIPETLDYVDISPQRVIRMVLRHRDLQSVLPFNGWWKNPITAVFTVKGCAHECVTCGSSAQACLLLSQQNGPRFRSPRSLVRNIQDISRFSRGPIFLVGDLLQGGHGYAQETLLLLRNARIPNQIVFELFEMPPLQFLEDIDRSVKNWSLELSPESHDETIRKGQDSTVGYSNQEMEKVIQKALALRCQRVDVFFMIGLPGQTPESVAATIDYCRHLFHISDKRLSCFISPLGPFLDPASHGFENPECHGYRLFAHTLEEHRQLLLQPTWQHILNYETRWMTRQELTSATYDAAESLNRLKMAYGRIDQASGTEVDRRIQRARQLRDRLDASLHEGKNSGDAFQELEGEIHAFSVSTVCDKRELFWRRHAVNFRWFQISKIVLGFLLERFQATRNHKPL